MTVHAADSSAIDNALIAKLGADAALLALMPNGVYYGLGPPGATRYVTVTIDQQTDVPAFGGRVQEDTQYRIVASGLSTANPDCQGAALRIDELLEDQPFAVDQFTFATMYRVRRIRETRPDLTNPSVRWHLRGGVYRVVFAVGVPAPSALVWTEAADALPAPNVGGAAVVVGGRMVVIGGADTPSVVTSSGGPWSSLGVTGLPALRYGAAVVNGATVFYCGGDDPDGIPGRKVFQSLDLSTWTEVGTDALPFALDEHAAVPFHGALAIIGGYNETTGAASASVLTSPDGAVWTERANALPLGLYGHAAVVLDDQILIIGGANDDGGPEVYQQTIYASMDGGTWSRIGSLPIALAWHSAAVLAGVIYLFGGFNATDYNGTVYASSDGGVSWGSVGPYPVASDDGAGVGYQGALWQIGGNIDGTPSATVFVSAVA
jgi:N-acetylneuraminic acid mutarotase